MGTSASANICPYCCVSVKLPEDEDTTDSNTQVQQQSTDESIANIFHCSRCNGAIKFKSQRHMKFDPYAQPIQYLHMAPFGDQSLFDELKISEEKEDISDAYQDMDEEMRKAIAMSMEQDLDTVLINDYLKPFFNKHSKLIIKAGNRFIIERIEFKIFGCYPPFGYVTNETQFLMTDKSGKLIKLQDRPIHRIHILPTKASVQCYAKNNKLELENVIKDLFTSHISSYLQGNDSGFYLKSDDRPSSIFEQKSDNDFEMVNVERGSKRFFVEGETFLWKNVEFRVMKAEPCDGYIDLKKTNVFCEGLPLNDIKKMSIRPMHDMLPIHHKDFTSEQVKMTYLNRFFYTMNRYIDFKNENDVVMIGNINFQISDCQPINGIVTHWTVMENASPIKHRELLAIQARKDEEYARQIQENERRQRMAANPFQMYGRRGNGDPFLQFIRLMEQFNAMRTEMEEQKSNNRGINTSMINTLPTFKYDGTKGTESENKSCRVCLEEYKDGEELRALPCFHSFHTACVDRWLQINDKCPMCKTSVMKNVN